MGTLLCHAASVRLRLIRTGYRIAWRLLWLVAPLHRGRGRGVKAILIDDGRVLLVQHTYGPRRWELPGGALHRRETPLDGVRREIREELGVDLADATLIAIGSAGRRHVKRPVSVFAAEIGAQAPVPDEREIARAQWFAPEALPARLGWHVAQALEAWASEHAELPVQLSGARRAAARRLGRLP